MVQIITIIIIVAMPLMCDGIFNNDFIANLLVNNPSVQEFWRSVSIWRCYRQKSSFLLSLTHGVHIFIDAHLKQLLLEFCSISYVSTVLNISYCEIFSNFWLTVVCRSCSASPCGASHCGIWTFYDLHHSSYLPVVVKNVWCARLFFFCFGVKFKKL